MAVIATIMFAYAHIGSNIPDRIYHNLDCITYSDEGYIVSRSYNISIYSNDDEKQGDIKTSSGEIKFSDITLLAYSRSFKHFYIDRIDRKNEYIRSHNTKGFQKILVIKSKNNSPVAMFYGNDIVLKQDKNFNVFNVDGKNVILYKGNYSIVDAGITRGEKD